MSARETPTAPPAPVQPAGRAAATITVLTALSRATGFARVLVVTAVIGDTFLGDVYQSANTLPNVLFELLAAGALAAVLVPSLVACERAGETAAVEPATGPSPAERLAGQVLGVVLAATAVAAVLAVLAAPLAARALTAGIDDPAVRADARRLAAFFLIAFAPQLLAYGTGLVATGALHARFHFAAPAIAPAVNNVVVIAAYLTYHHLRAGRPPSLALSSAERFVLAGGTTLAVVAFCAVPVVALARSGFHLRPRRPVRHDPVLATMGRRGAWAAVYVGATQLLTVAVLLLANGPGGQVVAHQFAFTVFLLPVALIGLPVATALYPRLVLAGTRFTAGWVQGLVATLVLLGPAAAALVALARPGVELALGGAVERPAALAHAVSAFGLGLLGYGAYLLLTRAWYALGDARTPAVVNLAVVALGVFVMVVAAAVVPAGDRAAGLAAAQSLAATVGAVVLARRLLARELDGGCRRRLRGAAATVAAATVLAAGVMGAVAALVPGDGRVGAAVELAAALPLGTAAYLAAVRVLGGPLRPLVALEPADAPHAVAP